MTDREWFAQIGICYDMSQEDMTQGEDPLASAVGPRNALIACVPFWVIIGFVIFLIARHTT